MSHLLYGNFNFYLLSYESRNFQIGKRSAANRSVNLSHIPYSLLKQHEERIFGSSLERKIPNLISNPSTYSITKKNLKERADVLKQHQTKNWLHLRAKHKANETYLHSLEKIKQNKFMDELFEQFDLDGSGTLDLQEMAELFNNNQIYVDMEQIKLLFPG